MAENIKLSINEMKKMRQYCIKIMHLKFFQLNHCHKLRAGKGEEQERLSYKKERRKNESVIAVIQPRSSSWP